MYKASIGNKIFTVSGKENDMVDGKKLDLDILEFRDGKFHIIYNNQSYLAEILSIDKEAKSCLIKLGNKKINVSIKDKYDELLHSMGIDQNSAGKINDIKAPMPGMVLQVMVENGQTIKKGDAIVVLEAMKMENILKSPSDGTIKKILVIKGDKVEKNQVMVNLD
jgi:biotin carboxyl carrier protein